MMHHLGQLFHKGELSRPALLTSGAGCTLTYAESRTLVTNVQRQLLNAAITAPSTTPPLVVNMVLPNSIEFILAFTAIAGLGWAAAPLNPAYNASEIEFYARDVGSAMMVVARGAALAGDPAVQVAQKLGMLVVEVAFDERAKRLDLAVMHDGAAMKQHVEVAVKTTIIDPRATVLLLHTSGTTSRPKCVPLSHANILQTMSNIQRTYQLTADDRTLVVMPLFHVHGLIGALLSTLFSGGSAVIVPRFSATTFWDQFERTQCTWYSAVPTIHQILLRHEHAQNVGAADSRRRDTAAKHGRIRFIRSCSAALAPATLRQLEKMFGVPVLEAYAMTEAAHQMTSNPLPPAAHKPGSVGVGQGVDVTILDDAGLPCHEGEVCIRGANVTSGYINRPEANREAFTADGWFRTGDRGFMDKDGYLFLTGRLKELINRGGEKISPLEVDASLLEHPAIIEAVTFAAPDAIYGEEVHAAVILRAGATVTEQALREFCGKRMAQFKCPKRIYFTEELPRTATGKIQRRIVAAHFLKKDSASNGGGGDGAIRGKSKL